MWTERLTVYYSKEQQYAVRWLRHGGSEEEAEFKTFKDKAEAERFYNHVLEQQGADQDRVELFFSQAKWVMYHANHDEFGDFLPEPVNESVRCLQGQHQDCPAKCTCPCHSSNL